MRVGAEKGDSESIAEINETEQDGAKQIDHSRKSEECRQHAHRNESATIKHDLPAGLFAARMYCEARSSVIFGEDPRDSEEVGHLPEKQDCEEREGYGINFPSCRRPSH